MFELDRSESDVFDVSCMLLFVLLTFPWNASCFKLVQSASNCFNAAQGDWNV